MKEEDHLTAQGDHLEEEENQEMDEDHREEDRLAEEQEDSRKTGAQISSVETLPSYLRVTAPKQNSSSHNGDYMKASIAAIIS